MKANGMRVLAAGAAVIGREGQVRDQRGLDVAVAAWTAAGQPGADGAQRVARTVGCHPRGQRQELRLAAGVGAVAGVVVAGHEAGVADVVAPAPAPACVLHVAVRSDAAYAVSAGAGATSSSLRSNRSTMGSNNPPP